MDAIKKKMQAMRIEKEAAHDKADQLEKKLLEQRSLNDKVSLSIKVSFIQISIEQRITKLKLKCELRPNVRSFRRRLLFWWSACSLRLQNSTMNHVRSHPGNVLTARTVFFLICTFTASFNEVGSLLSMWINGMQNVYRRQVGGEFIPKFF